MKVPLDAPRRRWYQFRLGPMMLAWTLLAAFLAYHINWIRERHELVGSESVAAGDGPYHKLGKEPVAPGLLWLFGEGAYEYIVVFPSHAGGRLTANEKAEVEHVVRLFPEAKVESAWTP